MKIKSEIIFTLHGIIVAIVILLLPWEAHAADDGARSAETLTLYLENDSFGFDNNDRYYTHGTKLSWVSSDLNDYGEHSKVAEWIFSILDVIPPIQEQECQRSFALSLGQNIYTPEDKTRSGLIEDDRPYAGITYLGFGFNRSNERHMDTLELNLGIVGRHSYAEDCQKIFHERIDVKNPKGWGNQLHDEPIVNICFEHKYKLFDLKHASGMGIDIIPHAGFDVGNAFTRANAGGAIRVGWNLPKDFGTFLIRSGSESNVPQNDEQPNFNTLPHRLGMHVFLPFMVWP